MVKRKQTKGVLLDPHAGQLVAITGGIATGKTYVLHCLKECGFEIFEADKAIHAMLERGGAAYAEVAALFSEAVVDSIIDRKVLGNIVLHDEEKLAQLEAILHPKLRQAQEEFAHRVKLTTGKSIVFEIPLLFENNRQGHYDLIIVTSSDPVTQKNRVMQRKNMTEAKFNAIIRRQVADNIRLKGAHFIIKTNISEQETEQQVKAIVKHVG